MAGFFLSEKAKADVEEIGRYTQQRWGVEQRNRYLGELDACFQKIGANPKKSRFSEEQIAKILREADRMPIAEVVRLHLPDVFAGGWAVSSYTETRGGGPQKSLASALRRASLR